MNQTELRKIVKEALHEMIAENMNIQPKGSRVGYVVMDTKKSIVGKHSLQGQPRHKALEDAIKQAAQVEGGHVHELMSVEGKGKLGDIIWQMIML